MFVCAITVCVVTSGMMALHRGFVKAGLLGCGCVVEVAVDE